MEKWLIHHRQQSGPMLQLPKRNNLVDQTADTLKEWMVSGILQDVLPGELELKERLRVGRDTLRMALQLLAKEGWLEPSAQGCRRRIHPQAFSRLRRNAGAKLPVTFLSPYPAEQGQTLLEMEETARRLAEMGGELRYLSPAIYRLKNPQHQLENLVQAHPSAAWVLYGSSSPVQKWFARRGLPALIHGWPYPGVDLCHVAKDWEPAGYHAGLLFLRHGHRNIGMFEFVERGAGAMLIEHGLRRALATAENEAKLLLFKDERTPESIAKAYEGAFRLKDRPTAMVLTSSNHLLTSFSWLVSKGIRVPDDVSLLVFPNDPWYADLYPPVCHYKPNTSLFSHGIADRVLELLEHGRNIRKPLTVPVEYVAGATIGPAPRGLY